MLILSELAFRPSGLLREAFQLLLLLLRTSVSCSGMLPDALETLAIMSAYSVTNSNLVWKLRVVLKEH